MGHVTSMLEELKGWTGDQSDSVEIRPRLAFSLYTINMTKVVISVLSPSLSAYIGSDTCVVVGRRSLYVYIYIYIYIYTYIDILYGQMYIVEKYEILWTAQKLD